MVDKSVRRTDGDAFSAALDTNEQLALAALLEGDLADAEKRLKVSEILMRQRKAKLDMEDDRKARAAHAKPVDEMSEAELRDELAKLLGIEIKACAGGGSRDLEPEIGRASSAPSVSDDHASRSNSTGR